MLLRKRLSDPTIVDMPTEEVEMTYAVFNEFLDEQWRKLERMLGVLWVYDDVAHLAPRKDENGQMVQPSTRVTSQDGRVYFPLAAALNPQVVTEAMQRFGLGGSTHDPFGDLELPDGFETLFGVDKEEFLTRTAPNQARARAQRQAEYDVRHAPVARRK